MAEPPRDRIARGFLMVGARGFEPPISCSRSRRFTGLSYAPPTHTHDRRLATARKSAPGRTRTSNLLIRSQMLYPIELRALGTSFAHVSASRHETYRASKSQSSEGVADRACASVTRSGPSRSCRETVGGMRVAGAPAGRCEKKKPHRKPGGVMGGTRLELVTSTMSTWRSNQLS